ncbi:FprA family A-type flavoprotein [candidate division WOR-3 bacterium]|nr:FprA family A-type flavoprotein [candidate division WOR-3 bacterium]
MLPVELNSGIFWIGVDDRTTDLFEGLWPISREGVSYNSYLIKDKKKAIIDLTKSIKGDEFFENINKIAAVNDIDYIIINHMEPDHSGILRTFRKLCPGAMILGSQKTKEMLQDFYGIKDNVEVVKDGDEISLGEKTLKFFYTPMVHWPETIMTYEVSSKILFSCDAFGSFGVLGGSIFDDECKNIDFYIDEAVRYYVNIVAKFSKMVLRAIDKLKSITVEVIAPSHGRIWRKNPGTIVELYRKLASLAEEEAEPGITLIYGSMYGNTENMMNAVAQGISKTQTPLRIFDVSRTHVSYILPSLWTQSGVMIGTPTYEAGLFPTMGDVLRMATLKSITNKKFAMFGSYGWSGGALREIKEIVEPAKWQLIDSFEFKGGPTEEELKKGEEFGRKFGELIKNK